MIGDLTPAEVKSAHKRGIFTITTETERGYYVTVFGKRNGIGIVRLDQSKECVRPRTARLYGARLVRAALATTKRAVAR